ncbi:S8 family peptidase [soil metagenome]
MKKLQFVFLSSFLVVLAACGGPAPTTGGVAGGFTLEIDNTFTNSLSPGAEVRIPVNIVRSGGFTGAVKLNVFGAPEGVSGMFVESNPPSDTESTLVVSTQNSVAAGMYSLSVRGESGTLTATAKVNVNVVGTTTEPTFSLALSPASLSTQAGKTVTSSVTVNKTDSFSSTVNLSATGAPNGVSVEFDPATTSGTSTVSVMVGSGVAAGNYSVTIKGSGGGKTGSTKLGLTVLAKTSGTARITGTARTDNAKISLTPTPVNGTVLNNLTEVAPAERPAYVPGQLLVKYRNAGLTTAQTGSYEALAESVQEAYGLSIVRPGTPTSPSLLRVTPGADVEALAQWLEQDPRVAYAEPNYYIYAQAVPNDPQVSKLWNMPVSGLPVAWSFKNSASNVTVAVLDTGIQTNHTDLQGIFVGGYDFCAANDCAQTDTNPQPDSADDRHGTHVTGTLAAVGNNGRGVAGVLYGGARIVPVKVFYQASFTTADALARAIRWAAGIPVTVEGNRTLTNPNPAKIINLSLGTEQQSDALRDAVVDAQAKGALLVAAAGNVGGNSLFYPARYSGVLAVGSVDSDFRRSCFSNYGSGLDIMAAGGDGFLQNSACSGRNNEAILSTLPGNDYGYEAGTSMATPLVAGVAALVLSQNPGFGAAQVTDRLKKNAYADTSYMTADQYGAGVVRADSAFGFPGPGASVSVTASGPCSAVAAAKLKLNGESTPFTLDNLAAGSYTVKADASGSSRSLSATQTVSVAAGESKSVTLQLAP